ncbi:helix-turn-helix domain-containing protein [Faecalispora anaeroviscerum]|uniref:helix-turn-helix domain-containing protein n=1 Tax=Faecalispora anaeroviscerum TaxID=2991836 RepID=UPI0024B87C84|nr:helix-turn-helix domain-containing protein [Faecalispora anaeroviscerum]
MCFGEAGGVVYKISMKKFLEENDIDPQNVSIIDGTKEFDVIAKMQNTERKVNMISDKIREVRQKKGLSQSELARRSGHAVSTIHGIENGDNRSPSFRLVCDIAKVLSIPLDELYQDILNER